MAKELIFIPGLTESRLAVWQSLTELEKKNPSLQEIADHAQVGRTQAGRDLSWLRDRKKVTWKSTRRSYEVIEPAPRKKQIA